MTQIRLLFACPLRHLPSPSNWEPLRLDPLFVFSYSPSSGPEDIPIQQRIKEKRKGQPGVLAHQCLSVDSAVSGDVVVRRRNGGRQAAPMCPEPMAPVDSLRPSPRELGYVQLAVPTRLPRGLRSPTWSSAAPTCLHLNASKDPAKGTVDISALLSNITLSSLMRSLGSILGTWAWDTNHSDYELLIPFKVTQVLPDVATTNQSLFLSLSRLMDSCHLGGKQVRVS